MKTSNLILLSVVSMLLLFVAAVPVLYHRELSHMKPAAKYLKTSYKPGKTVKVINTPDITVFQYDSLIVESLTTLETIDRGDTLIIDGSNNTNNKVLLYLPNDHHVVSINSTILLCGLLRTLDAPAITFTLTNTRLHSLPVSRDNHVTQNLNTLTIVNRLNSTVDLRGSFDISNLVLDNVDQFTCAPEVTILAHDIKFPGLQLTSGERGRYINRQAP